MAEENSGGGRADDGGRRKRRSRFLAEELQEEILVRLPIKSVIRFESVCKTWLFMLRSRGFTDLYDGRRPSCCYPLELHTISFADLWKIVPGLKPKREKRCGSRVSRLLGPLSNGIYCIASHRQDSSTGHTSILTGKIALFNPATRDCKFTNPFPRRFHSTLSNISSKPCSLHLGFGKVKLKKNSSEDYRVVVLVTYGSVQNLSLFILAYSVQRGVWKKLVDYEPGKRNVGPRKATQAFNINNNMIRITSISYPFQVCPQGFFEGCYHWVATKGEEDGFHVLSFDFADESFQVMGGPPPGLVLDLDDNETVYSSAEVVVLHGRLAAICLKSVASSSSSNGDGGRRYVEISVWTMMEYGVEESWTRIYTIHPNFDGQIRKLYGIHYSPLENKNENKSGAGARAGIRIEKLFFRDWLKQTISCDDAGYQVSSLYESKSKLCWNTPGISTYIETLERL